MKKDLECQCIDIHGMIFFTKLKKLKKLNKRSLSPSFTLLELIIVIVIIGILISTISFNISPDKLNLAADDLIKNIRFTESLALKDDKYQPFPINNNVIEQNRSKYWFKQWWQIRFFKDNKDNYYYEIFSDVPSNRETSTYTYNFDDTAHFPNIKKIWYNFIALNSHGKLLIGKCGGGSYPNCDEIDTNLNLTKTYGITQVKLNEKLVRLHSAKRLMFDNYGNIFLSEGEKSDKGDINPLDKDERKILTTIANIKLYSSNKCIQINVTPTGEIYKSKCN
jgi:prepilin-type N-terminal cleavage/methylation domain-containing protein